MSKIKIVRATKKKKPICPHCDKKIDTVYMVPCDRWINKSGFCYICGHCDKVLGFGGPV